MLGCGRRATLTGGKARPRQAGNSHPLKPDGTLGFLPSNISDLCVELRFLGRYQPLIINGRTSWIADANHNDEKRFVVRADEILTAFLELEAAIPCQKQTAARTSRKRKPSKIAN